MVTFEIGKEQMFFYTHNLHLYFTVVLQLKVLIGKTLIGQLTNYNE